MIATGVNCISEETIPILIHRLDILRPDLIGIFYEKRALFKREDSMHEILEKMIGSNILDEWMIDHDKCILTDRELVNSIFTKLAKKPCNKKNKKDIHEKCIKLIEEKGGRI